MTTPTAAAIGRARPRARRPDGLLCPSGPPRRAGMLAASATFGWRALLKIKHEPKQLTDVIAIPVLITVVFTYIFGGAISGTPGNYLKVLLPGTLSMSVALVTMYGGARLAQDVTTGVFDRFRSLPVWRGAFVLGGLLSDAGRYLFASGIVVVLGLIMGYRPDGGAPGVLAAVALVTAFGLALSWLWATVALLVRNPAVLISIANVVLMPLSFASNVFVQARTMPRWLQAFVNVNPISHLAGATRDLMNNVGGAGGAVAWTLIATATITLVFAPLTLHLYGKQR
ncbi:MAG TPA: ABC transporter permease [Streptosporangiaceae bacterium]|nr:ABC transporter permease [Streptosporangiaceae bacterium]